MQKIWHHAFYNELRVDPQEHPVLLTEIIQNPKANREKMMELQFETFNVPSFYLGKQPVLSLFCYSRVTGIVLEAGDGVIQIVPTFEGIPIPEGSQLLNRAGRDLTDSLTMLLVRSNSNPAGFFPSPSFVETVRDIKEECGCVAVDLEAERSPVNYTLPDRTVVKLCSERFEFAETLFRPWMDDSRLGGIQHALFDSITKFDPVIRRDLYANIILSGGTTMLPGFPERLEKEIKLLAPAKASVKVVVQPDRKYAAWIGGSIVASLETFPQMVIKREEYNDGGPGIVRLKCP
jgi:actin